MAAEIASHSPLGVQMTKRAIQANTDAPSLATAVELENRNQVITHAIGRGRGPARRLERQVTPVRWPACAS